MNWILNIKIYFHDTNFLQSGLISLIGPFYSQELLQFLKQAVVANPHLFTYNIHHATHLLGNVRSFKNSEFANIDLPKIIIVDSELDLSFDKPNNTLINFTSQYLYLQYGKQFRLYAPYNYAKLTDFPEQTNSRYNQFTFSIFSETICSLEKLIYNWIEDERMIGTLYCFYHKRNLHASEILYRVSEKLKSRPNKHISFTLIHNSSNEIVYRALQASVFSLHLDDSLSYPFWAARLKCYPVVKSTDVFSRYVKYIPNDDSFSDIIESFYQYPKQLASLIEQLGQIQIPQFNLANLLNIEDK